MSRLRALRAVPLILFCFLMAVPGLQAANWGAGQVPVSHSSFAGVWDWLRAAVGLLGPEMDPNGANGGDVGHEIDPDGAQGDLGHDIDPNG
jgi:hypothetical protein